MHVHLILKKKQPIKNTLRKKDNIGFNTIVFCKKHLMCLWYIKPLKYFKK